VRLLSAIALALLGACAGSDPARTDRGTPYIFVPADTCPGPEIEIAGVLTMLCASSGAEGCICGHDDGTGRPTGSCHSGACCQGCWDSGDPANGIAPRCWPGDGTGGLYGSNGAGCRSTPS
jgi:hypothetical protein